MYIYIYRYRYINIDIHKNFIKLQHAGNMSEDVFIFFEFECPALCRPQNHRILGHGPLLSSRFEAPAQLAKTRFPFAHQTWKSESP